MSSIFFKKVKLGILFILLSFNSSNVFAIDYVNVAQKIFSKSMSIAHWGILVLPPIGFFAGQHAAQENLVKLPDVSSELEKTIKEEMKKCNVSENLLAHLKIKVGKEFSACITLDGSGILTVPEYLKNADMLAVKEKLAAAVVFNCRHEIAHIEGMDFYKNHAMILLSSVCAHFLFNGLTAPFVARLQPSNPIMLQSFLRIPAAFAKIVLANFMFRFVWSKYKEYNADKRAANNIGDRNKLNIMAEIFQAAYEKFEKVYNLDQNHRKSWSRFIVDEIYSYDHPNYLLRALICKNAADELNKKQPSGVISTN